MRSKHCVWVGALVALALIAGAPPALAQGSLGVFGGIYEPDDSDADRTEVFGIRGGYRFNPNFGFEASVGRVDLADAFPIDIDEDPEFPIDIDFEADLTTLDLSFQWYPTGSGLVVFGGPGWARIDADLEFTFLDVSASISDTEDLLTAHLGVGYQWDAGERFYIRPEVRARRYFGDEEEADDFEVSYEATDYEASVTFGFRFGSP